MDFKTFLHKIQIQIQITLKIVDMKFWSGNCGGEKFFSKKRVFLRMLLTDYLDLDLEIRTLISMIFYLLNDFDFDLSATRILGL